MNAAAGKFYRDRDGKYDIAGEGSDSKLRADELADYYAEMCSKFPIVSIENGMSEEDWYGWAAMTKKLGGGVQLAGVNPRCIENGAGNSVIVKLNQIGSLSETLKVISMARAAGYSVVISHMPGETEDTFIADLAVATASGQIKAGAPARTDGTAKYNQLLRIEESIGGTTKYAGISGVKRAN